MTDSGCTTSANVYCAQRETRRFLLPANLCDCLLFTRPSLQTVTLSNGVRLSVCLSVPFRPISPKRKLVEISKLEAVLPLGIITHN